jgi:hypothetical protein
MQYSIVMFAYNEEKTLNVRYLAFMQILMID